MWHFFTYPAAASDRRRPRVVDTVIAAATFAGWFVLLSHGDRFETADLVLLVASTLPLAGWRISPTSAFAASTIVALGLAARGQVLWPPLGPAVALYLLAASRDAATPWSRRGAATVLGLLAGYLTILVTAVGWVASDLAHLVLGATAAWFAGERSRLRRQQITDLHDRAHRAAESAAAQLRLAVAEERARIARDLHDSAGHALNVIAVRAGAARLRGDPHRALTALTDIETVARDTVADIDQIIGSLRASETRPAADEPPIGLASADALIAQHQAAGLRVAIFLQGDPGTLGRAVDQAAYRILQEALTNAARHGTGSASVTIRADAAGCALTVTNPAGDPRRGTLGGHGIPGMRERAHLLGGTLTAAPSGDEFQVVLRLPQSRRAP
ncbi:integral membrane sensor signal transduction histidine kinase [Pseudofrankia inefficax]|uniref:histidine kinase n=1 Tax=Pseudofrankia inefficax (strain DSM 45817 / CECT 9037 / DDB 130130 / EuI1c) TaxID=298654 RepID=E3J9R1_PSEI1|nr:integral membrane sensor signal transduction histidine kinase [Pseudofrankia inefficax]